MRQMSQLADLGLEKINCVVVDPLRFMVGVGVGFKIRFFSFKVRCSSGLLCFASLSRVVESAPQRSER
ncbi:hypothetical protein K7X08_028872 [Anisodus acutangulus]|uniref:Uncharacterized protein n=1 Tax=Anisodus acutangulus TaxID=402998 RepID=A0A9Q1L2Y8_9SOLA|nr:hypothetical protein K7X08_028872 [Anisodus acutangulus]